jgi:hypothetical protein
LAEREDDDAPPPGRSADETMDASAFVEELQAELETAHAAASDAAPGMASHEVSMPPPLPPKKLGRTAIVAIVAVAVVGAVAAILVSNLVFDEEPRVEAPAPAPVEETEPVAEEEPTTTISLDTVVIGAEEDDPVPENEEAPAE